MASDSSEDDSASDSDYAVQTAQDKLKRKIFRRKLLICVCVFSLIFVIAAGITVGILLGATNLLQSKNSAASSPSSGMDNSLNNSKILHYIDTSYDPCEDFYNYSCGQWNSSHLNSSWEELGAFDDLQLDTYNKLAGYLSQNVSSSDTDAIKKAKYIYSACTDVDYI